MSFYHSGLCSGSSFDQHYYWSGEYSKNTELYYFRGFSSSLLRYDPKKNEWKLTMYSNPNIYATCNESIYPFGTLNWYFFGDTCTQIEQENILAKNVHKLMISFNACDDNNEFTCSDGTWWVFFYPYKYPDRLIFLLILLTFSLLI